MRQLAALGQARICGSVEGRDKDRAAGILQMLRPGGRKRYEYSIEAVTHRPALQELLALNA